MKVFVSCSVRTPGNREREGQPRELIRKGSLASMTDGSCL